MSKTFVIAECGSSWRFGVDHLLNAKRIIEAAKACGADAAKFQWTSDPDDMAKRRGLGGAAAEKYREYLAYPKEWLPKLKYMCEVADIEFMCTVFLIEDIPVVAPLVKKFKVSAYESGWSDFMNAYRPYWGGPEGRWIIASVNPGRPMPNVVTHALHCISKYPTPEGELGLSRLRNDIELDGLSDHTTSILTGALAVAMGATIIEKHVRLWDTPEDNPDFPHSLVSWSPNDPRYFVGQYEYSQYVTNIREAERAL